MTDLSHFNDFALRRSMLARPVDLHSCPCVERRAVIVVPCYNEARRLDAQAFLDALLGMPGVDFLMVDDGSTDETPVVLQLLAARAQNRIAVLTLDRNGGKAEAVRRGLLEASARNALFVGFWDADLATPLHAIWDMLRIGERLGDVTVIFGSRRSLLGHRIRRDASRRIVSLLCNLMARFVLSMPIGDTQCGAKLLRNTSEVRTALAEPFQTNWLFDIELFARIAIGTTNQNEAFYELPLAEWTEMPGSKVSTRTVLRAGIEMIRLIAINRVGTNLND